MYCRKCGKEVEENSKFCPFCGYGLESVQDRVSDTMKQNSQSQKADKNASPKKWIIPVGIIVGIVVIGIVVFLGVEAVRKPEEVSKPEVAKEQEEPIKKAINEEPINEEPINEEQKEEIGEEEPVQEVFQERPFTPDVDTEARLKGFVREIAYMDYFGEASIIYYDDAVFCQGFLAYSAYHNGDSGKLFGKYPYEENWGGKAMEESVAAKFLQDSLGKCDISALSYLEDGRSEEACG